MMRLGHRIVVTTGTLVVVMGLLTMGLLHAVVSEVLGDELDNRGLAMARVLANDLANPLLDGDALVVQRNLNRFRDEGLTVVYAFVLDPERRQVIHTFPTAFPAELLRATRLGPGQSSAVRLLLTEEGRVRDYGVRLLDGIDPEIHVGLSEVGILASAHRLTWILAALTAAGVAVATVLAWLLGRYVARPLEVLTGAAEAIGEGRLDREIPVTSRDEVGALAESFNRMVRRLQESMERERNRIRELSAYGAVARLVSLGEEPSRVLTEALEQVTDALNLRGAWIVLLPEEDGQPGTVAAIAGLSAETVRCCETGLPYECTCRSAALAGGEPGELAGGTACPVAACFGAGLRVVGPFPLVAGGRILGFLNAVLPPAAEFPARDHQILKGIGQQLGVALERARIWQRLMEREATVSQLLQRVIDAQEEERRRIARELHDETSQSLAALAVGLKAAASLVRRDPKRAETILESLKEAAAHTLREVHNIVYDLRPTVLDDMGLVPALQWCASRRLADQDVAVEVSVGGTGRRLPRRVETTLFRIGQEAVNNVARHAAARNLRIHLQFEDDRVCLSVADDGRGFDVRAPAQAPRDRLSLGLAGMAERAKLVGGECVVNSVPGEGTRVDVTIPIPPEEAGEGG